MTVPDQRDRGLTTVLFTDIEGSTELAASLGDREWRKALDTHDSLAMRIIEGHDGRRVGSTGDGVMAVFESPGRAVGCGLSIVAAAMSEVSLSVRAGLHTGECEFRGDDVAGIVVHVAARVSALAQGGQVLVSRTLRDLVAGDDLGFVSAGSHVLKGVPGRWQVFEAVHERPVRKARAKSPAKSRVAPISVVLIDDHPLWRQTLKSVVEDGGVAKVVGEAGDGGEALALVRGRKPDVLVIDMDLPTMTGVEATSEVAGALPGTKVLVLSSSDDPHTVLGAVRAGASGYLLKTAEASEIREAITRVAAGELVFPSALSDVVRQGLRGGPEVPERSPLTARELEVLDLMAEGLSNAAVGKRLFLSSKTVEAHVGAIFVKLEIEPTDDVNRRVRAVVAHLSRPGQN